MENKPDPRKTEAEPGEKWLDPFGLPAPAKERMADFLRDLEAAGKNINLISYSSREELYARHLADSLMALEPAGSRDGARALDLGSGGGFPGIPLALARVEWSLTLVESVGKKCEFLKSVIGGRKIANARVLCARAEELARDPGHRENYDLVFCRAVGALPVILELALPFIKVGGAFLPHRGPQGLEEAKNAGAVLEVLGGKFLGARSYKLPGIEKELHILRIEKISPSPQNYPRRPGIPVKRPLS